VLSMSDLLRMQTTGVGGTTKTFRDSCLEVQSLQDPDIPIQIKSCVKDLGELVHYNKSASIGFIREKLKKVFEGSKELNGCRVNYKKRHCSLRLQYGLLLCTVVTLRTLCRSILKSSVVRRWTLLWVIGTMRRHYWLATFCQSSWLIRFSTRYVNVWGLWDVLQLSNVMLLFRLLHLQYPMMGQDLLDLPAHLDTTSIRLDGIWMYMEM
jgi:hypothetical protein